MVALADECGDHTGDQPESGDLELVHARRNTRDGPLASPESQEQKNYNSHLSNRSVSDQNNGAAFLTIYTIPNRILRQNAPSRLTIIAFTRGLGRAFPSASR